MRLGSAVLDAAMRLARLDLRHRHRQPSWLAVAMATVLSLGGSLAADALLVALGTTVFPSTHGYVHFRFSDYGELTVIGVLIACAAWPVVTRISWDPRWLFFRLAILVTLVLWLPDVWILAHGAPPRAVAVLMVMHLAIALATYNLLVRVAAAGPAARAVATGRAADGSRATGSGATGSGATGPRGSRPDR